MRIMIVCLTLLGGVGVAWGQSITDDYEVTLRFSELQLLVNKAIADREAAPVLDKIQKHKPPALPQNNKH